MKLLIAFAAVALAGVLAEPKPNDYYNNYQDYQQKNVDVIVEKRPVNRKPIIVEKNIPVVHKTVVEKEVPFLSKVIVERRIPIFKKVVVERPVPVVKKVVEITRPREVVVVKRPSYDYKGSDYGSYSDGERGYEGH